MSGTSNGTRRGFDLLRPFELGESDLGRWNEIEGLDRLRQQAVLRLRCEDCRGEGAPICRTCSGSGEAIGSDRFACGTCGGDGTTTCEACDGEGDVEISIEEAISWPSERRKLAGRVVELLGDVGERELLDLLEGSDDLLTLGLLLGRAIHASGATDSGVDFEGD